jgi:hypothetical protein
MGGDLIEYLKQVEDFRTTDRLRHKLWLVLLFVITAIGAKSRRSKLGEGTECAIALPT